MISTDLDTIDQPARAAVLDRLVLWAAAASVIILRSHVADAPLEADECNYLYMASRLIVGDRLYVDVWDHQPPGVFWMFAALCGIFGDSPATLRWAATAAALLSLVLLFDAARRSFGRRAAWLTAGLLAVGHVHPLMAGEGGNREIYMNALAAAAMWALVCRPAGDVRAAVIAGLCLGLMSLLKTVGAAPWLFVTLAAMLRSKGLRSRWRLLLAFSGGPAVIWAMTIGAYAATGRLYEFVDAVFLFNLSYSGGTSFWGQRFLDFFAAPQNQVIASQWPVWLGGALGTVTVVAGRESLRRDHSLWAAYVVGAYVAVCLPGRFWPHYYLLAWQPMVVLSVLFCVRVADRVATAAPARKLATAVASALIFTVPAVSVWRTYLSVPPNEISRVRYGERMEWARRQGERIRAVTRLEDTVYVWGSDVGIYYYGGRRAASRYSMNTALTPQYKGFEGRRETLMAELEARKPVFILVPDPEFDTLARFLVERYYWVGEDRDPKDPSFVRAKIFQHRDRFRPDVKLPWPRPSPPPN